MEKTGMTFTRKELYDMLSHMTIRRVATDWHLDLRSLIDVIKANEIPCSSEAAWIATNHGVQMERRPPSMIVLQMSISVKMIQVMQRNLIILKMAAKQRIFC